MPETILLAFICAKIKKYNIKPLFKTWHIYPVIGFEILILIGQVSAYFDYYEIVNLFGNALNLYLVCYLFAILRYELYKEAIIGSVFVVLGGLLNDIAIKANDGVMPVFESLSAALGTSKYETYNMVGNIHVIGNIEAKFKFLTDYIDLGYNVLSIGDIFIRVFVFITIYYAVKKINSQRRN